ncbi:MAG: AAA family ATPase [Chloroflexi bacterium]|nr:AAA family ATPase [Chloroflexota bacterium]
MDTLIIEDFRCFAGRNEVPTRPLTLLVGENSTGKTSFLAAVRASHELLFSVTPDFNEEPFRLGSYDQIANYRGGRAGRAKSFAIGQRFIAAPRRFSRRRRRADPEAMRVEAKFSSTKSQPRVSSLSVSSGEFGVQVDLGGENPVLVFSKAGEDLLSSEISGSSLPARAEYDPWFVLRRVGREVRDQANASLSPTDWERFDSLIESIAYSLGSGAYAFAPIRTSPRRTYDPTTEVRDPEGSHIPMMLERLLGNGGGQAFRERLEDFGQASGLYSSLNVRKLGRTGSDPFQVEVKHPAGGRSRNLVDVGYGVSQAIPIIADCVSAEPEATLLIQQPEVHLHPRAQAAMGSFFAQLADSGRNGLIVETHSDYLLDRVRVDVREQTIKFEDVIILYFEQDSHGVNIHPIELDETGNLVDVPTGYRRFFLEEQRRFLGID